MNREQFLTLQSDSSEISFATIYVCLLYMNINSNESGLSKVANNAFQKQVRVYIFFFLFFFVPVCAITASGVPCGTFVSMDRFSTLCG
jgi:hypothetical protein